MSEQEQNNLNNNEHPRRVIERNHLDSSAKKSLKWRTIIGLGLAAIVIPCLFLGGYFYIALMTLFLGCATYEFTKAPAKRLSWFVWVVTFFVVYALVFWGILKYGVATKWEDFDINTSVTQLWLSPYALIMMIFIFFFIVTLKDDFGISDASYLIAMTLLISLGFQALLFIRFIPFTYFKEEIEGFNINTNSFKYFQSSFLLYYLLIGICFNDMGAYFVGILFGKHKINPRISPKKTWEGFVGGIIISCLFSMIFAMVSAGFGWPIIPKFNIKEWYWIFLCSIILPFIGNLGDFTFSAIKRHFGVKDYSHVLGPHGGILDRIDSVLFGALVLAVLIIFISHGWDFYKY